MAGEVFMIALLSFILSLNSACTHTSVNCQVDYPMTINKEKFEYHKGKLLLCIYADCTKAVILLSRQAKDLVLDPWLQVEHSVLWLHCFWFLSVLCWHRQKYFPFLTKLLMSYTLLLDLCLLSSKLPTYHNCSRCALSYCRLSMFREREGGVSISIKFSGTSKSWYIIEHRGGVLGASNCYPIVITIHLLSFSISNSNFFLFLGVNFSFCKLEGELSFGLGNKYKLVPFFVYFSHHSCNLNS